MKYIMIALMLFAPVAFSQELVVKQGKRYTVVTPDCKLEGAPLKISIQRVKPGRIITIFTTEGVQRCRVKVVKRLQA